MSESQRPQDEPRLFTPLDSFVFHTLWPKMREAYPDTKDLGVIIPSTLQGVSTIEDLCAKLGMEVEGTKRALGLSETIHGGMDATMSPLEPRPAATPEVIETEKGPRDSVEQHPSGPAGIAKVLDNVMWRVLMANRRFLFPEDAPQQSNKEVVEKRVEEFVRRTAAIFQLEPRTVEAFLVSPKYAQASIQEVRDALLELCKRRKKRDSGKSSGDLGTEFDGLLREFPGNQFQDVSKLRRVVRRDKETGA